MNLEPFLQTALEAAHAAGALQLEMRHGDLGIEAKDIESDLVTRADQACEEAIRRVILFRHPDHAIVGEEGGEVGASEFRWIVDPIDGTVNYAHGFPQYNVSIGLEVAGHVVVGVVFDAAKRELFRAVLGGGAFLNDQPIRVSSHTHLGGRALVGVGATSDPTLALRDLEMLRRLVTMHVPVRRAGSGALDLCYVACGRYDAFLEAKLMPWDCAAGTLIIREAGGRVTDYAGGEHHLGSVRTLATNGLLHEAMLELLREW